MRLTIDAIERSTSHLPPDERERQRILLVCRLIRREVAALRTMLGWTGSPPNGCARCGQDRREHSLYFCAGREPGDRREGFVMPTDQVRLERMRLRRRARQVPSLALPPGLYQWKG